MTASGGGSASGGRPRFGVAFLLAQVGAQASGEFARALADHDLTPALAGVLRMLITEPGLSQLQLAERLGAAPSRVVSYLDDLEARGWITRNRHPVDRRVNVLDLTDAGREAFASIAVVGRQHEAAVTAVLDPDERTTLFALLSKLAAAQGLSPGIHPGFRQL